MIRTVTHKYLKRQFENFEKTEEVDELLAELQFSTLILPISMENGSFNFPAVSFEDENYAPVFTDIYEYDKLNFSDDFIPVANDFDFYMNLLEEDVDGIVLRVVIEQLVFRGSVDFVSDRLHPNHLLIGKMRAPMADGDAFLGLGKGENKPCGYE